MLIVDRSQPVITLDARPVVTHLTPATTDHDALTVAAPDGEGRPSVPAFLICRAQSGNVIYEVLNEPDHATYVFRGGDVPALNRALDLIGFQVSAVHATDSAGSAHRRAVERSPALRVLRDALAGRVFHTEQGWHDRLNALL